jgi:hypothetical protein
MRRTRVSDSLKRAAKANGNHAKTLKIFRTLTSLGLGVFYFVDAIFVSCSVEKPLPLGFGFAALPRPVRKASEAVKNSAH